MTDRMCHLIYIGDGMNKQIKVPDYSPSDRQTLFHITTADEALYGGAAGG